jgi:hypothetical protein
MMAVSGGLLVDFRVVSNALRKDDVDRLAVLLSTGIVSVDAVVRRQPLLFFAVKYGAVRCVRLLCSLGASPLVSTAAGTLRVSLRGRFRGLDSVLAFAVVECDAGVVEALLDGWVGDADALVDVALLGVVGGRADAAGALLRLAFGGVVPEGFWIRVVCCLIGELRGDVGGLLAGLWSVERFDWLFDLVGVEVLAGGEFFVRRHCASGVSLLGSAALVPFGGLMDAFLRWGANPFAVGVSIGTPYGSLMLDAISSGVGVSRVLLRRFPVFANAVRSGGGLSALTLAVHYRRELVADLLSAGALPDVSHDSLRVSPLMTAVSLGDVELVRELLAAGADVTALTVNKNSVFDFLLFPDPDSGGFSRVVLRELVAAGLDVNGWSKQSRKPYAFVALGVDEPAQVFGALWDVGLDLNVVDADGNGLLHAVALGARGSFRSRVVDLVRWLVARGVNADSLNAAGLSARSLLVGGSLRDVAFERELLGALC